MEAPNQPVERMAAGERLLSPFLLIALLLTCSCDFRPQPTYNAERRILAIYIRPATPPPRMVRYLLDTNPATVMHGRLGDFEGIISVSTRSSNAAAWRVQIICEGKMGDSPVFLTNAIDVPYPQSRQISLPRIGTATGWFLSDAELVEFDQKIPK